MDKISNTAEEIRDFALAIRAAEVDDGEDHLEHHGVQGMKWGVRSQETLRKYGLLKGTKKSISNALGKLEKAANARMKGAGKAVGGAVSGAASAAASKAGSSAKAFKDKKVAEVKEKRLTKAEIKAQRKELGMSKAQYDKLREKTLKSHDPREVAKGMHTLTDRELSDKIRRLKSEGEISGMAETRNQQIAKNRQRTYEAIKKHPLYEIVSDPVKQVAKGVIVNQLYKNGFGPVLQDRIDKAKARALNQGNDGADGESEAMAERIARTEGAARTGGSFNSERINIPAKVTNRAELPKRVTNSENDGSEPSKNPFQSEYAFGNKPSISSKDLKKNFGYKAPEVSEPNSGPGRKTESPQEHYDRVKAEGDKRNAQQSLDESARRYAEKAHAETEKWRAQRDAERPQRAAERQRQAQQEHYDRVKAEGDERNAERALDESARRYAEKLRAERQRKRKKL